MSSARDNFKALLKANGQSVTKVRLRVFEALLSSEPLTMRDLVARAGQVDRASVYRAVDLFERLGVVQRLHTGWKYKLELSDKFTDHHHHLTCVRCGKTVAMNEDELERMIHRLSAQYDFTPTAHQIEIQGLCGSCRKAADTTPA